MARAGLERATIAVVEHELAGGNHAAALSLLADVDAPELAARARAGAAARATELAALEKLRAENDPTIGRRTRTFIAALFGGLFTLLPLASLVHHTRSQRSHIGFAFAFLGVIVIVAFWARRTLMATQFNRRLTVTLLFNFTLQGTFALGQLWLGADLATTEITYIALWAAITGMLAITVDARLAVATAGYIAAYLLSSRFPDQRPYLMSGSNLVLALNAIWLWRPATFRPTSTERARM